MPQYELMYIIGSQIAENDIPQTIEELKSVIQKHKGKVESQEDLGKKKLAYPIKKTRNGNYVLVRFSAQPENVHEIEAEIRSNSAVIRHLILNIEEALRRMKKDLNVQAKMKPRRERPEETKFETTKPEASKGKDKKIQIDLDAEIEKALDADELK